MLGFNIFLYFSLKFKAGLVALYSLEWCHKISHLELDNELKTRNQMFRICFLIIFIKACMLFQDYLLFSECSK